MIKNKKSKGTLQITWNVPSFLVYTFGFKLEFFLTSRFYLQDSNFLRLNLSSSTEVASAAVAAIAAGRTAAKRTGTIAASAAK